MNSMVLPLSLMLASMLVELGLLARLRGVQIRWLDVVSNLDSGHLVLWLFRGVEVAAYGWVLARFSLDWATCWQPWIVWCFAFVAWDLGFYWLHRLHHRFGFLWAVHVVHHQGEHFNLSLGIRNSWYSSLTSFPFFIPLALLGIPLPVFVAVSSVHYAIQFYNHSGLVSGSGPLDRWLVTPQHHRVHHGANPEYVDKNFGGTFLLWDKLFGSFQSQLPGVPIEYGTPGMPSSHNPFWSNQLPLLRYLGLKEPRVHVQDAEATQARWIASGGVLVFALVVDYVAREGQRVGGQQPALFGLLVAATLVLGALSDGRRWARTAWVALAFAMPVVLIGVLRLREPIACLLIGLLVAHAIAFFGWGWVRVDGKQLAVADGQR